MQPAGSGLQHVPKPKKSGLLTIKKQSESVTEMKVPTGKSFSSCYMELCKTCKLRPLPNICLTLLHYLEFTADRIKIDEWSPILNSLSFDRTLISIGIRSRYYQRKPFEEIDTEAKARANPKIPVIQTRYLLERLTQSLTQCVRNSPALTSLELDGVPLPPDCLAVLCVGLSSTKTLRNLSLSKCYIGDSSCVLICKTIANVPSIKSLNLSYCDLTCKCGPGLSTALTRQNLRLFDKTWQQSLRYREPDLETMSGLRRLTLNGNSRLGDSAVSEIIEVITDSLWLKALDLQNCGLTDLITSEILDLIEYNKTLVVVDVRLNSNLREELATKIAEKLEENKALGRSEYKWLSLPKRELDKATKRNDGQDDLLMIRANNKKISKDHGQAEVPKTAPCRTRIPIERGKMKSPYKSMELPKPQTKLSTPKPALHLNLKAEMQPCVNYFNYPESRKSRKIEKILEVNEDNFEDAGMKIVEIEDQDKKSPTDKDFEDLFRKIADARAEHERLLEETKRNDMLLSEERVKREMAEMKLRSLKDDLSKLENALKEKERETRGFLLVNETSLDEICISFDNLLERLDSVKIRNESVRSESEEETILKADILAKMTLLIRKTKSESLRRGYFTGEVTKVVKKLARSEADMRNNLNDLPPINLVHLERHIGDSPDIISPSLADSSRNKAESFRSENSFRQTEDFRPIGDTEIHINPSSANEIAKIIFSKMLTGNMVLSIQPNHNGKVKNY